MDKKPAALYRGAKEKMDVLKPAPVLETEKHRFPAGTEAVVFASQYKEEALAYAIASRRGLGGFTLIPYLRDKEKGEIGWKLKLNFSKNKLEGDEEVYLYELNSEEFSQNTEGEWYSTTEQAPVDIKKMTIDEALGYFDEISYESDVKGEGNGPLI